MIIVRVSVVRTDLTVFKTAYNNGLLLKAVDIRTLLRYPESGANLGRLVGCFTDSNGKQEQAPPMLLQEAPCIGGLLFLANAKV